MKKFAEFHFYFLAGNTGNLLNLYNQAIQPSYPAKKSVSKSTEMAFSEHFALSQVYVTAMEQYHFVDSL